MMWNIKLQKIWRFAVDEKYEIKIECLTDGTIYSSFTNSLQTYKNEYITCLCHKQHLNANISELNFKDTDVINRGY